jgi:Tfp pilus assembly protein PilV
MLIKNLKGVSLLEAFLASIIFIIGISSVFITLSTLRRPAVNNEQAVGAALVLSNMLDSLRSEIDKRDVDSTGEYVGNLRTGTYGPITSGDYTMYYNVYDASGARRIDANVTWVDAI